jgi:hypothetical protein
MGLRKGVGDWLEGVREPEEELCGFRKVLDVGGQCRREAVPCKGELNREAVSKPILYEGGSFLASDMNERGGVQCGVLKFQGPLPLGGTEFSAVSWWSLGGG